MGTGLRLTHNDERTVPKQVNVRGYFPEKVTGIR